ncbi:hypothetical protein [Burkholderia contaminans]|uniref:hypothetical protein n=1 Tax=Burkholderia contaminans TaxID=488447 RepID=UPI0014543D07|nr:hypothetical protein [Burkholderia contaminans]VWC74439.1 hypothetical protein BCO18442_00787 [Burkholderia contaminans]
MVEDLSIGAFVSRNAPLVGDYIAVNPVDDRPDPSATASGRNVEDERGDVSQEARVLGELRAAQAAYVEAEREVLDFRVTIFASSRQGGASRALDELLAKRDLAETFFNNIVELLRGGNDESTTTRKLSREELVYWMMDRLGAEDFNDYLLKALDYLSDVMEDHDFDWMYILPGIDDLIKLIWAAIKEDPSGVDCLYKLSSLVYAIQALDRYALHPEAHGRLDVWIAFYLDYVANGKIEKPAPGEVLSGLKEFLSMLEAEAGSEWEPDEDLEAIRSRLDLIAFIEKNSEAGDLFFDGLDLLIELAMWKLGKGPAPGPTPEPDPDPDPDPDPPGITLPPISGKPIGSIWEAFVKSIKHGQSMLKAYEHWFSDIADIYDSFVNKFYSNLNSYLSREGDGVWFNAGKFAKDVDSFFKDLMNNRRVASADTKEQLQKFFKELGIDIPDNAFKKDSGGRWYVLLKDIPDHPANKLFDKIKDIVVSSNESQPSWEEIISQKVKFYLDPSRLSTVMSAIEAAMSRFEEQMQLYGQKYADMHSKFENLNKTIASLIQIMADMAQSIVRNI